MRDQNSVCRTREGRSFPWIMEDLLQFANIKHDTPPEGENKSRSRSICGAGL